MFTEYELRIILHALHTIRKFLTSICATIENFSREHPYYKAFCDSIEAIDKVINNIGGN